MQKIIRAKVQAADVDYHDKDRMMKAAICTLEEECLKAPEVQEAIEKKICSEEDIRTKVKTTWENFQRKEEKHEKVSSLMCSLNLYSIS